MKAALALVGFIFLGAALCLASSPLNPLSMEWRGAIDLLLPDDSAQVADNLSKSSPPLVVPIPILTVEELLFRFSSPIKLTHDEINLYNPEDLAALLALKPSVDIFSLGSFGQKRGFSNWGREGKGDEILYNGIPREPIYLNYPQSTEADLTPLQHETADSVYFFDHPLASFLSGTQSPTSAYLFNSEPDFAKPLVTLRLNKGISEANPFSSSRQSTFLFDVQRPLGKKAYARGVGSFKNRSRQDLADHAEVQSYHLSVQNSPDSKNRWRAGYELDRELGAIVPFTGIPDSNLGKNFRRDVFFAKLEGQISPGTKVEADLHYQRTDQRISSIDTNLRRRAEERRPYFGLGLTRQGINWFSKLFTNVKGTSLNQHPTQQGDWLAKLGGLIAVRTISSTHFSFLGQISESRFFSPRLEGWAGISQILARPHRVVLTVSSQVVYPSAFDQFFENLIVSDISANRLYAEVPKTTRPERSYKANFTYEYSRQFFKGGFSLIAERGDGYLVWKNLPFDTSFAPAGQTPNGVWGPTFQNVRSVGGEIVCEWEIQDFGIWKGGYGLKYMEERETKERMPLSAKHRAYLRLTTGEVKPLRALSLRLVPMAQYFSGFKDDVMPYLEKEAFLINLKAVGAVQGFNFYYEVQNVFDREYSLRGSRLQNGRAYYFGFNWALWD